MIAEELKSEREKRLKEEKMTWKDLDIDTIDFFINNIKYGILKYED